jgi:hypothetical protein
MCYASAAGAWPGEQSPVGRTSERAFGMSHILLTGAGFSRNWGCWLADEVFECLLAEPKLTPLMRAQLLRDKNSHGNYETTIQALRDAAVTRGGSYADEYKNFIAIIGSMLDKMRDIYVDRDFKFEKTDNGQFMIEAFLYRFDAIFTLNQDTLEHHYLSDFFPGRSGGRWAGWDMPGIYDLGKPFGTNHYYKATTLKDIEDGGFSLKPRHQPYFKLHGSHNWETRSGLLLITGANKETDIGAIPLLDWNLEQFRNSVCNERARLMIIGYSFGDRHINGILLKAAAAKAKFFIVHTAGIEVMDKRTGHDQISQQMWDSLGPHVIGASRRPLATTFGADQIEHTKLQSFFDC